MSFSQPNHIHTHAQLVNAIVIVTTLFKFCIAFIVIFFLFERYGLSAAFVGALISFVVICVDTFFTLTVFFRSQISRFSRALLIFMKTALIFFWVIYSLTIFLKTAYFPYALFGLFCAGIFACDFVWIATHSYTVKK